MRKYFLLKIELMLKNSLFNLNRFIQAYFQPISMILVAYITELIERWKGIPSFFRYILHSIRPVQIL